MGLKSNSLKNLINKFKGKPSVFFDKIKNINIPEFFTNSNKRKKEYYINENNFYYLDDLKNIKEIPKLNNLFNPYKNIQYYCLAGFIYSFYFDFEYNLNNYPIDWFNNFIV